MELFIVFKAVSYEGSEIFRIFTNFDDAIELYKKLKQTDTEYEWVELEKHTSQASDNSFDFRCNIFIDSHGNLKEEY